VCVYHITAIGLFLLYGGQRIPLVSHKGTLAIAAVIDVAINSAAGRITAKALATRHELPPRHLEPVLQALVRDGILKGIKGPHGGCEVARDQAQNARMALSEQNDLRPHVRFGSLAAIGPRRG
jgi:hypothetical protein